MTYVEKQKDRRDFFMSELGTVREVAQNFGGIPQMRDEYFELQKEIYR